MSRRSRRKVQSDRVALRAGLPPASDMFVGPERDDPVDVHLLEYDAESLFEQKSVRPAELRAFADDPRITWIDVDGVHDPERVKEVCNAFKVHPLVVEDILSLTTRPKSEEYDGYLFLSLKIVTLEEAIDFPIFKTEQASIVLAPKAVLTFLEGSNAVFDVVRDRLRTNKGRGRRLEADYLVYALLDAVVDGYLVALDQVADHVDQIEDGIVGGGPDPDVVLLVHHLRQELLAFRKNVVPVRDGISAMNRAPAAIVRKQTLLYLRDLHDHILLAVDTIDGLRDRLSAALDLHVALTNNRLADVNKVLTVVATIFLPITFIASVYGMNFDNIPELHWQYGYHVSVAAMLACSGALLLYFRRKGWV
jgi:magnesium transporter